ncbi:CD63 antigen-like [Nilaparvata lugens]|uniref:CD63 antigen-like n=1 Tax=Nilaparvata lugens TaxID=108931 RepID=UPI00193D03ED|nr:CD63 antigen-like [Nilaparvata lugens]
MSDSTNKKGGCLGCFKCCSKGPVKRASSIPDIMDEKIAKRVKSLVNAMKPKRTPVQKVANCFHVCAMYCCHIIFAILNIFMLICGLYITALSGYLYHSMTTLRISGSSFEFPLPIATFVFGSLIIILAVFGFACTGRAHCLVLYSSCLIIIMLLEILLALHIYVNYAEDNMSIKYQDIFKKVFKDSIDKYSDDEESWKFVDMVQRDYGCCGVNSSADWYKTPLRMVPASCCEYDCTFTDDNVFSKGCPEKLETTIKDTEKKCYALTSMAMPLAILYTALAIPINGYLF